MCARAWSQMEYAAIKPAECDRYREHKEKRREEEVARLQREWAACTDTLRSFVDQHNLRHVDPSGVLPDIHLAPCTLGYSDFPSGRCFVLRSQSPQQDTLLSTGLCTCCGRLSKGHLKALLGGVLDSPREVLL